MPIKVIEGLTGGDEGKADVVNIFAADADIVAGFNGGTNAGHTVVTADGTKFKFHVMPAGILHDHVTNVIGNGKLIEAEKLGGEIDMLETHGIEVTPSNLKVSSKAHLILPYHISLDEIAENQAGSQGSTKSGIRFCAADKMMREGYRANVPDNRLGELERKIIEELQSHRQIRDELELDIIDEDMEAQIYISAIKRLRPFFTNTSRYLTDRLELGKRVIAESAQGFLLDVDHGLYPHTTSSNTGAVGASAGLGVPQFYIDSTVGVMKAMQSKVGGGPFITEQLDKETLEQWHGDMSAPDAESGTTTGRQRRLGHIDLVGIKEAIRVGGAEQIALTKLDWVNRMGNIIKICVAYKRGGVTHTEMPDTLDEYLASEPVYELLPGWKEDISDVKRYEDLPGNAQLFVHRIEQHTKRSIAYIGVGQREDQKIRRQF